VDQEIARVDGTAQVRLAPPPDWVDHEPYAAQAQAYRDLTTKLAENRLTIFAQQRFGKIRPSRGGGGNALWFIFGIFWLLLMILGQIARTVSSH
jgi:hypothetical protein